MYLLAANHDGDCTAELKNGAESLGVDASAGAWDERDEVCVAAVAVATSPEVKSWTGAATASAVADPASALSTSPTWAGVFDELVAKVRTEEV